MGMTAPAEVEDAIEKTFSPIDKVGTDVSLAIHNVILSNPVFRAIGDLLHGTWLGHPLHPIFTDITIGAWVMGSACDALAAVGDNDDLRYAADRLIEVGELSAIPTALTGATDFSTFPDWSATPATIHGAMNMVNIGLYAWSIQQRRSGHRARGVLISSVAFGLTCVSAWIGGALVYKHKVGVSHADKFEGPKVWTPVREAAHVPERKLVHIEFEDKPVILWREQEHVWAMSATCTHAGGPLHEGKIVDDHCVQCPWHDSVFDLHDGGIVHGPATFPQPTFEARMRNGWVEIRLEA